jgi:hypothetical protein
MFSLEDPQELEDSPDLLDEEIESATSTTVEEFPKKVFFLACKTCFLPVVPVKYAVRRRKPHTYWRVSMKCMQDHIEDLVFRIS